MRGRRRRGRAGGVGRVLCVRRLSIATSWCTTDLFPSPFREQSQLSPSSSPPNSMFGHVRYGWLDVSTFYCSVEIYIYTLRNLRYYESDQYAVIMICRVETRSISHCSTAYKYWDISFKPSFVRQHLGRQHRQFGGLELHRQFGILTLRSTTCQIKWIAEEVSNIFGNIVNILATIS